MARIRVELTEAQLKLCADERRKERKEWDAGYDARNEATRDRLINSIPYLIYLYSKIQNWTPVWLRAIEDDLRSGNYVTSRRLFYISDALARFRQRAP